MIRVTIEVLPDDHRQRSKLGQIDISNTGAGWPLFDYFVSGSWAMKSGVDETHECTIKHHPDDSVIRLVSNALKGLADK